MMSQSKAEEVVARLLSNAADLKFGQVAVCIKFYNGHLSQVVFSTTENEKVPVDKSDDDSEPLL